MNWQISNECEQDREGLTPEVAVSCSPAAESGTDARKESLEYLLAVLGNCTGAGMSRYFWEMVGLVLLFAPVAFVFGLLGDSGTRAFFVGLMAFLMVCTALVWLYCRSMQRDMNQRARDLLDRIQLHAGDEAPVPRQSLEPLWFLSLRTSGEPPEVRQRAGELYRRLKSQEARGLPIAAEVTPTNADQLPRAIDSPPG